MNYTAVPTFVRARTYPYRSAILGLVLLVLTACGFHPLYAESRGTEPALAQIFIANIANREGQTLRNLLIDKMAPHGQPTTPKYNLVVSLKESDTDFGFRTDATSARSQISFTANYVLTPRDPKETPINAYTTVTVGYNKLDAQYSNLSAEEDARQRCLGELSEQIVTRLSLYFGSDKLKPSTESIKPQEREIINNNNRSTDMGPHASPDAMP